MEGAPVTASNGLISYFPEFSGFGEFRNGERLLVKRANHSIYAAQREKVYI